MAKPPNETYSRLRPQRGWKAQFTPEPSDNLPAEYRQSGVRIGDVGIWSEDSFDVVFNACLPVTDPINRVHGVPRDFKPISLLPGDISKHLTYYSPKSVLASGRVSYAALDARASSMVTP